MLRAYFAGLGNVWLTQSPQMLTYKIEVEARFHVREDHQPPSPLNLIQCRVAMQVTDEFLNQSMIDPSGALDAITHQLATGVVHQFEDGKYPPLLEVDIFKMFNALYQQLAKLLIPKSSLNGISASSIYVESYNNSFKPKPSHEAYELEKQASRLPGWQISIEMCPEPTCATPVQNRSIPNMVIHLNDFHKWDRHKIADWADNLHDNGVADLSLSGGKDD